MAKEVMFMTNTPLKHQFLIGDVSITRQEIAIILTFDGFGFVASKLNWSDQFAAHQFSQMENIEEKLTNEDCEQFATGFASAIVTGETRYQHVLSFTSQLFEKWGLLSNKELKQSA